MKKYNHKYWLDYLEKKQKNRKFNIAAHARKARRREEEKRILYLLNSRPHTDFNLFDSKTYLSLGYWARNSLKKRMRKPLTK